MVCRLECIGKVRDLRSQITFRFLFSSFEVGGYLFSVLFIIVRKNVGVRHADSLQSKDSCHFLFVDKVGITELGKPVEVVEYRVIYAVSSRRTNIGGGHAEMLEKYGVIRPAA